jgi:hypothetical protein
MFPPKPAHGQDAAAAGRVGDQLVAGKVMGLPVGAAAPSMADRVRRRARAEPCAWSA